MYTNKKGPGILEEGGEWGGKAVVEAGRAAGREPSLLPGMGRSRMAQAVSVWFMPVFLDLESFLRGHGRTSGKVC